MDPKHRDRVAFVRLASGHFTRGMKLLHVRSKKPMAVTNPVLFLAADRELAEEAWAGDIIGIPNHGQLRIGDALTEGEALRFTGIPSFAPELLQGVRAGDPMKAKHLEKALMQFAEEGAAKVFKPMIGSGYIVGVVGALQFDVLASRIEQEYQLPVRFEGSQFTSARWVSGPKAEVEKFVNVNKGHIATTTTATSSILTRLQWDIDRIAARLSRAAADGDERDDGVTRQNRVMPDASIVAVPARGTLTGNRGILHDEDGRLGIARWRHCHWISCELDYKGWRRRVMSPGTWTELFFLDEAVALAAGHRPCALCRRADYTRFVTAWTAATGQRATAADMDRQLHAARVDRTTRLQVTHEANIATLPDGCFIRQKESALPREGDQPPPFRARWLSRARAASGQRAGHRDDAPPARRGAGRGIPPAAASFGSGDPQTSFASIVISAFSRREIGQLAFAPFAAARNASCDAPGIFADRSRCTLVTVGAPSMKSSVTVAVVSIASATRFALPSSADSAIEKHPAWAAPISSSGLLPFSPSKRLRKS